MVKLSDADEWDRMDRGRFLAYGGLFTVGVDFVLYPLELVKTRVQVESKSKATILDATVKAFRGVVSSTGLRGLWRGFPLYTVGGLPSQGAYFYGYTWATHRFAEWNNKRKPANKVPLFVMDMAAGFFADVVAAPLWTPTEVVATRMQIQGPGVIKYDSTAHAFRHIFATEGIAGFFRGLSVSILAFGPASAVWWSLYQSTNRYLVAAVQKYEEDQKKKIGGEEGKDADSSAAAAAATELESVTHSTTSTTDSNSIYNNTHAQNKAAKGILDQHTAHADNYGDTSAAETAKSDHVFWIDGLSGLVAGTVSSVITNPLDIAKTRLQTQHSLLRDYDLDSTPAPRGSNMKSQQKNAGGGSGSSSHSSSGSNTSSSSSTSSSGTGGNSSGTRSRRRQQLRGVGGGPGIPSDKVLVAASSSSSSSTAATIATTTTSNTTSSVIPKPSTGLLNISTTTQAIQQGIPVMTSSAATRAAQETVSAGSTLLRSVTAHASGTTTADASTTLLSPPPPPSSAITTTTTSLPKKANSVLPATETRSLLNTVKTMRATTVAHGSVVVQQQQGSDVAAAATTTANGSTTTSTPASTNSASPNKGADTKTPITKTGKISLGTAAADLARIAPKVSSISAAHPVSPLSSSSPTTVLPSIGAVPFRASITTDPTIHEAVVAEARATAEAAERTAAHRAAAVGTVTPHGGRVTTVGITTTTTTVGTIPQHPLSSSIIGPSQMTTTTQHATTAIPSITATANNSLTANAKNLANSVASHVHAATQQQQQQHHHHHQQQQQSHHHAYTITSPKPPVLFKGMFPVLVHIIRTDGPRALIRGVLPRMMLHGPASAATFICYEQVKRLSMKRPDEL